MELKKVDNPSSDAYKTDNAVIDVEDHVDNSVEFPSAVEIPQSEKITHKRQDKESPHQYDIVEKVDITVGEELFLGDLPCSEDCNNPEEFCFE